MENPDKTSEGRLKVLTFGCRLNAFESEVMLDKAKSAGLEDLEHGAILVNTCAVTGEAVRQARQAIRRAHRENPGARVIVSGCAAQTEAHTFSEMSEVDLVIGNEDKLHAQSYRALPDFGVNDTEKVRVNDIMEVRETAPHMISSLSGHSRAFVQVQNGCNHRCTFCIIPYGRGNSRSAPMGSVIEQIRKLVENGYCEVVLTGVDTTSYGADLPGSPSLGTLVRKILDQVPELPRLRLSSIDSIEVDEPLMEIIANDKRFMPHLHLSLQHGDNMILKRMKRRHLRDHTIEFCAAIRKLRPDICFGADMIAGFPTETDEMFENSLSIVDECGLDFLHVFPFSPRPGTPASKMPQLSRDLIKERAGHLRKKGELAYQQHLDRVAIGVHPVLVERGGVGRLPQFTTVETGSLPQGEIVAMQISGHNGKHLMGEAIRPEKRA
ncbi:MAG: tRNA (N(6)-L-threonylcarbamoyladenosine(37)-C(2))-methylthiotransferase MtaB [Pseudomonadota bacterium]